MEFIIGFSYPLCGNYRCHIMYLAQKVMQWQIQKFRNGGIHNEARQKFKLTCALSTVTVAL